MNYWLMKTEPDVYSMEHLKAQPGRTDHWDGIRNYQVRNMLRDEFARGDLAFMYYSNCKIPAIVAIMEIARGAYPDHTAFDPDSKYFDEKSNPANPRWLMVDVKFKRKLKRPVSLAELRTHKALQDMRLLAKGNRLSIMPVTEAQWQYILELADESVHESGEG